MLIKKNNELIQEVTELRNQNSNLKAATESMRLQIEKLTAVAEEKNNSSHQKRKANAQTIINADTDLTAKVTAAITAGWSIIYQTR